MENIYCISGLGADERIFKRLEIKGAKLHHLPWVSFDKHDELGCYAQKMAAQIPEKDPIILGLSFGGMLATEIAKMMPVRQAFLISSAKGKHELPDVNRALDFLVRHKLIPYGLFKQPNKILYQRFGADTEDEQQLLADIMKDTDSSFLGWAFKSILEWQNRTVPPNIIHIHGTNDQIIQPAFVQSDYWLHCGTHMMVYSRAEEIGTIISGHISAKS